MIKRITELVSDEYEFHGDSRAARDKLVPDGMWEACGSLCKEKLVTAASPFNKDMADAVTINREERATDSECGLVGTSKEREHAGVCTLIKGGPLCFSDERQNDTWLKAKEIEFKLSSSELIIQDLTDVVKQPDVWELTSGVKKDIREHGSCNLSENEVQYEDQL
ncbi:unnamed protein product [Ilex paraguariensis]|uniref:Uncharacterized protein n=1 Tax=Ilex paraguariensis TaxID=185542 RepID=A0ABC8QXF2_9AQUA